MTISRIGTGPRMSQAVIHGDTVYLAGQVGSPGADVATQTQECLDKVDGLLAQAGSGRDRLLQVTVWLTDMADFDAMNAVYDAWVVAGATPTRACGESRLASPEYRVEVIAVAAR
ncbi:RidA family protein [Rhodobacteraceae bacterium 2CG4]|uniref:RidA family protein n=1 Tax=Halovulum marinum TaxID=2662447 RepID=A0A6L5Z161_9RHOB|nr:RidA family protein [Halovulum marinum]MSU90303.1 RidA family protein [Halovulum marinum]